MDAIVFEVGDRVVVDRRFMSFDQVGRRGIVASTEHGFIGVDFGEEGPGLHNLGETLGNNSGYWFPSGSLVLEQEVEWE